MLDIGIDLCYKYSYVISIAYYIEVFFVQFCNKIVYDMFQSRGDSTSACGYPLAIMAHGVSFAVALIVLCLSMLLIQLVSTSFAPRLLSIDCMLEKLVLPKALSMSIRVPKQIALFLGASSVLPTTA